MSFIDNYKESDMSCDACLSRCSREGRRRNPANWTYDSVPQPQYMHRGYTMHVLRNTDCGSAAHCNPNVEQIPIMYNFYYSDGDYIGKMLDEFGLINMNGRCYDPVVGRFLSPDIIVQNPNNTQCYNRYSYAINNPLKYNDPSGWSYGTLAQMHDAEQRAAWQEMQARNRQLQHELQISNPKEARILALGLQGKNGLSGTADGTFFSDIQSIASTLQILGLSGVFGNPEENNPSEDEVETDEGLVDRTSQFNKTIKDTKEYFSNLRIITDVFYLLSSPEVVVAGKLYTFSQLTETGAKFDLKNGEYSEKNADKYSLYNGKKVFFEEYGNYNFGVAAAAFGIPIEITLAGAGLNELWKWWKNEDGNPDFSNWIGFFDNRDATSGIIRGYFGYPFK